MKLRDLSSKKSTYEHVLTALSKPEQTKTGPNLGGQMSQVRTTPLLSGPILD
jgi:hypothetical protein